jgi:hypothetical protein
VKLEYKTQAFASHQPLTYAIANTIKNGKVIEYGAGDYSTGLLHYVCEKNENLHFTVENDERWYNRQVALWPGFHWHSYIKVQDYTDLLDMQFDHSCDLAFIDSYTWGTRLWAIQQTLACKNWKYMIVHDAAFILTGHTYMMDVFKKHNCMTYVHDTLKPITLLITNGIHCGIVPDYETEEI